MRTGYSDIGNSSSAEVSSSMVMVGCFKLTIKTKEHNCQLYKI